MPADFRMTSIPSDGIEARANEPHSDEVGAMSNESEPNLEYSPSPEEDDSSDNEGTSVEKRRILFIAAVVLLAVFIFIWNVLLNFGKIVIKAEPPYSVLIFNEKEYQCAENPCVIKLKRGEKSLSFFKLGYKAEGKTIDVPLWHSIEINPIFELEPYVQEIEKIGEKPFITANIKYKIEYDKLHHNWKLFEADDKSRRGLSYFPEKLDNPLIFGSNSAVLIVERDNTQNAKAIYFIDLKTGERNTFQPDQEFQIKAAKPSLNGKFFLTDNMMIANKENLKSLKSTASFTTSFWTPFNKLIMVSDSVVLYDPETELSKTLIDSMKLENNISNIIVSPSSTKVYIESSSKKYQVVY
jgi:hypothetical protein